MFLLLFPPPFYLYRGVTIFCIKTYLKTKRAKRRREKDARAKQRGLTRKEEKKKKEKTLRRLSTRGLFYTIFVSKISIFVSSGPKFYLVFVNL